MELLVLSDSHGHTWEIREALARQVRRPAGVCFLGDGLSDVREALPDNLPLYAVAGNCDGYLSPGDPAPYELTVTVGGVNLYLSHGHLLGVKSGLYFAESRAYEAGADVFLFGHTHEAYEETVPADEVRKQLILFNPGSIADGRFGVLTVRDGKILPSHGTL